MPSWREHIKDAQKMGLNRDTAREIDLMLDFPEVEGVRLGHKCIHNMVGVLMARERYGSNGARYARTHIMRDLEAEATQKFLKALGLRGKF